VGEFALKLAAILNDSNQQTLEVLEEVTVFFTEVAGLVNAVNSTVEPMVYYCLKKELGLEKQCTPV
jgi:hypothetical protein